MKTRFIILFLLIGFIAIVTKAQVCDIKGDWTGKLSVYGNEIPLVFHFDGEKCTIDSPDQGAKGIPAQLERTAMGIKVAVPSINANYEGVNIGDSVMGTFKQHGQSFPLTLKPGSVKRNRPQTPTPLSVSSARGEFQKRRCRIARYAGHTRKCFQSNPGTVDGDRQRPAKQG